MAIDFDSTMRCVTVNKFRAVSLLGAGENKEAKKALKEALKMTNRVELHDAISHLKQLQKKNKSNGAIPGESPFVIIESTKFKTVGEKTTVRQELASALQIRALQNVARLIRCNVELLKKEMSEHDECNRRLNFYFLLITAISSLLNLFSTK
jgi:HEAT repeat protein